MTEKSISVSIEGLGDVLNKLGLFGEDAIKATAAGLYQEAEIVTGNAKEIVPVDTGALKGSGHVKKPTIEGSVVSVEMGFGGPASAYALRVHEDLSMRHAPGKQAKYLEEPALAREKELEPNIAARVEKIANKYRNL